MGAGESHPAGGRCSPRRDCRAAHEGVRVTPGSTLAHAEVRRMPLAHLARLLHTVTRRRRVDDESAEATWLHDRADMPASYRIDRVHGVVLSRGWGVLAADEVVAHYRDLASDPDFDPGFVQLIDLRNVERIDMSFAAVRSVAERPVFAAGQRRAILVSNTEQFGVARMYGSLCAFEGEVVDVFRELEAAARWLGIPAGAVRGDDPPTERADTAVPELPRDPAGRP